MQRKKTFWSREKEDLIDEINRLKEDNDRQQQLLATNLTKSPHLQSEAYLQSEISRLIAENLVRIEQIFYVARLNYIC